MPGRRAGSAWCWQEQCQEPKTSKTKHFSHPIVGAGVLHLPEPHHPRHHTPAPSHHTQHRHLQAGIQFKIEMFEPLERYSIAEIQ